MKKMSLLMSWEVMNNLLAWGEAKVLASFLGVKEQTVRKWCNRPQNSEGSTETGRANFLEYFRKTIAYLVEVDGDLKRAHILGDYICAQMDSIRVSIPNPDSEPSNDALKNINKTLKRSIDAVEHTRESWFDKSPGEFDEDEYRSTIQAHTKAMQAHAQMIEWIKSHES